jgi:hypothetical protein
MILAAVLTGTLVTGLAISQYAREDSRSSDPVYTAMLEKTFNQPYLEYQYEVSVWQQGNPIDTSKGAIYKAGPNYIDSNNMYVKVLNDEVFVNFDKRTAVVYYTFLKEVEQKLGFKKEDMNAELFSLPDSNIAKIGHWKPIQTLNDSLSAIEFEVTDSAQQLQKARFVIQRKKQQIREAELTIGGGTILGSKDQTAVIRMYQIKNDSLDLKAKSNNHFSIENGKFKPSGRHQNYSVQKLF